ncbi:class A beta-lactamase [Kitasatospora cineracea]|uniref:Beta-lactamase n=1 Tax=Kitasatospora cineracea TaxID=88074 RepID=A0A3N4RMD9_9ACTN|nr:class A beta-lactamase [Kitasatospora cineracea]ROR38204.1 beta-lactamase class A [Kitasatospora cineracea]RPE31925.1 beta-lactamase class A [Kitasatospora cineracea]
MHPRPARRHLLTAAGAAALACALPAPAAAATTRLADSFRQLEREHGARLGVLAHDTGSGATVRYRADEAFPLCSTFKPLAVAALMRAGDDLSARVHYTDADVADSGHAPVTGRTRVLTVAELCAAAIEFSDNTAANLLLRRLGGPTAVTRFCRSLGDPATRLDRWEPALNSAEPDRSTDTTTPHALARTFARLTLGDALARPHRARLTAWLRASTTGTHRLRAGLPPSWALADKTGTGSYGTANDLALAWPPHRPPLVLAVLSTRPTAPAAAPDEPLLARTAALLAAALP